MQIPIFVKKNNQDDFETFSIMRKSQYFTWTEELLHSFFQDLLNAEETMRHSVKLYGFESLEEAENSN